MLKSSKVRLGSTAQVMFRPKDKPPPTTFRLPKLKTILKDDDLQFLLAEAGRRYGVTVELPFVVENVGTYMLTIKLSDASYQPVWTYYRGDDERAQMIWQHPSGDINLIFNLCAGEIGQRGAEYTTIAITTDVPHLSPADLQTTITGIPVNNPNETVRMNIVPGGGVSGKTASLEGDLSNMQVPTLLQSINMSKMTGCLRLTNQTSTASIWFEDGMPTHAENAETQGDQAIVEMITWEEGEFHFYPDEKRNDRTVKGRVDGLLMQGVTLLDQNKYIKEAGVKPQSYLVRSHERITEDEFKAALAAKGAPLDFEVQKRFYSYIDNASTLMDVLRRVPMIKNEWAPIMFNLLSCGLIVVSDTPPAGVTIAPVLNLPPYEIDRMAIQGIVRSLTRQETGVFTFPTFLFLLEQEFQKCAALGMPLSLLVFDAKLRVGDSVQALPMQFVKELLKRIDGIKRPFDVLGHFETFEFGLFMVNTNAKSARVFAVRLMEMLSADPFIPKPFGQLVVYFGIACAPEDTMELNMLLAASKEGKKRGIETGQQIITTKELTGR